MNNFQLIKDYKEKNYNKIIVSVEKKFLFKKNSEKDNIFFSNLLGCCYVNLHQIDKALKTYSFSKKIIKDFDGPEVKYNIGILPENVELTDRRIGNYIKKKIKKTFSKKKINDLINSLKINPDVKGSYHSNLGLTLISLIKINKFILKKNSNNSDKIFYLNPKYNSFRAEKLLKKKKFLKFKKEVKKILKYNPINMRLFAVLSYAIQKYKLKKINFFCSNTLKYIKEFDLLQSNEINNYFINSINDFINRRKSSDSFAPGSVYTGYKSVGNIFEIKNKKINILENILNKKIKDYLKFFQYENEPFINKYPKKKKIKGWYIRIKKGGGIDYHIHNAWLSGVMYTKLPHKVNSGKLGFSIIDWGFKKEKTFCKNITPKTGKLVLFPSSLPHRVNKFDKNFFRISLAFDIVPI